MKKKVILIGGGGHAESIIDALYSMKQYKIIGILDKHKQINSEIMGLKVIGDDSDLENYFHKGIKNVVIAIGSMGMTEPRQRIYKICKKIGFEFPNIIDKSAVLAENVTLGEGNFIGKGTIVNAKVSIGNECIINTGVIIEHDSKIENFVHIAPGTIVCGSAWIKENTHVGAHSTIIQNVTIGENTLIGAGSLVLKDISPHKVAYGSPVKEVKTFGKSYDNC